MSHRFERVRWGNLFLGGLHVYFQNLRQVNRFLSSLAFHVSLFRGDESFEVNPVDLIALEALRLFDPEVHEALPPNKEVLTAGVRPGMRNRDDEHRRVLQGIVELAPETRHREVREMIKQLFPPAEWAFGGSYYSSDFTGGWFRELRVCSPEVFDRYFHFAIPQGDLSQTDLDRILGAVEDRTRLVAELRSLARRGLLGVALDRLEAYKQEISLDHARPFVTAIFDIAEDIPDDRGGMVLISPGMHAVRIVYWYLKQEQGMDARLAVIRDAIGDTDGISIPVHLVSREEQGAAKQDAGRERFVTDEGLAELKQLCIQKITAAADNDSLVNAPDLVTILYRWRAWSGEEAPRNYCERLIQTPDGAMRFTRSFVQRSTSQGLGDYVGRERWYMKLGVVEDFVPWEALEGALEHVETNGLGDEDARALTAFREAVERRRQGKPDAGGSFD